MDVQARLDDHEDQFVERKLEGARASALRRTIVAFANSLPPNRTGVLFIGVEDDGTVRGVSNSDRLQKTLRKIAERDCYPPIYVDLHTLRQGEKVVVAAVVSPSLRRPHFAGPAFVRRGSESIEASDEEYAQLLLSQDDKRRFFQDRREETWSVEHIGKKPGEYLQIRDTSYRTSMECKIEEITAFYVRFSDLSSGLLFTEVLADIQISYDDKKHRPKVVVSPAGR